MVSLQQKRQAGLGFPWDSRTQTYTHTQTHTHGRGGGGASPVSHTHTHQSHTHTPTHPPQRQEGGLTSLEGPMVMMKSK